MITTNNKKIYKLSREYKDHGHQNNPNLPRGRDTRRIPGFNFRTTELNAALGLAQLKKIKTITQVNKRNYNIIFNKIKNLKEIIFRKIPKNCYPLHDCLIFRVKSKIIARKFVKLMVKNKINTKNLPDAIEWHFAKHWIHILKKYNISKKKLNKILIPSSELLEKSIAIPISSKKDDYKTKKVAETIYKIALKLKLN